MRAGPGLVWLVVLGAMSSAANPARGQDTDACINASEKAVALRKAERLIEQRASLSTCAASSCPDAVRTSCQQRLAQADQAIPSIVFFAKDGTGRDLAAVKVTIDGALYADHLDGSVIALDPGEHEFRFEMAGQPPAVKRFVMHQGEQDRRETILLGDGPIPATIAPRSASAAPGMDGGSSGPGTIAAGHDASGPRSTQRTAGLLVGGVALASLAAGAIFGGLSIAAHGSYEKSCGGRIGAPAGSCNLQGINGESDAVTKGTISTVFFIGGGVAAVAGGALFFTAPRPVTSAQVGVGAESIVVSGHF
jgi:hypothetical protein